MGHSFFIDGREVGPNQPPYIIAELSGNHNGSLDRAITLIKAAKETGADAVKLQTYTADSLTIDTQREEFVLKDGTWAGRNLYQLYKEAHTPWDWFPELFKAAKALGITVFSSPFEIKAIDLLEDLGAPAYKIASNEFTDWPLVERAAKTGKPLIMSTGASTREQVEQTLAFAKSCGARDISILHCVSEYPAPPERANIRTIDDIIASFPDAIPGFSDHTLGNTAAITAIARGACIIEKHFTLNREDGGVDSTFSSEPDEMKRLCEEALWAWKSLGGVQYGGETNLKKKGIFTRQFWTVKPIKSGDMITNENIKSIRAPQDSGAISTMRYRDILGKKATRDIREHEPLLADAIQD